ncbi:intraflagellar transport protein 52 [Leishmania donovani]|uniref:Intraflagellar_transport_protein_52_-_putative n=3 Tax=Leishmania donovani species complex TaxID=38574 RepID=A0A6L0XJD9_LEIIN|nr:putative intraflagellar transport protein component [Leishmania infantum JPCM5]CAC9482462.1 intraflagellar_transport_protein_52_-_putative [Leishmania infantum]CAJ1988147.1 intraflagellar transport protein 52 [Leishmania donovani]CAM67237.2 putative intraflagellar transport protein component [Leishmania infantum JPCM5]SUZ41129.1 intraflagellar_transport_protein_52_-_putative [Leishmania infantum]VDZ44034.1 intraflagellar_transport_protein_52_putative/GeneDB:LmjF.19.0320 [Leishmania donovani|eukprot:XP_001464995.2 putative intraflagellar transport protein component [Leishmania infantum JPCM5]
MAEVTSPYRGRVKEMWSAPTADVESEAAAAAAAPPPTQQRKVCFNVCRQEPYHPSKGYRHLARKLRQGGTVEINKEDITLDRLSASDIVLFPAPQTPFSEEDLTVIRQYVEGGGSAMILLGDGHGGQYSYLNKTLDDWTGITINEDCVVRTVLHRYLHPKEVCVTNGITNRAINKAAGKKVFGAVGGSPSSGFGGGTGSIGAKGVTSTMGIGSTLMTLNRTVGAGQATNAARLAQSATAGSAAAIAVDEAEQEATSLVFVYPYGLTFNVQRPAIPLLSSGFMAYPLNRPIAAAWECPKVAEHLGRRKQGKLLIIGSAQLFDDAWIEKEENSTLASILFDYLDHKLKLNQIDADEPDITDYHHLPDTASLSERLRVAVEQHEELPRDFTQLFELDSFKIDTDKIPDVVDTYSKLSVKVEPLTLIPPEFQTPLPPVKPAVFEAIHRDPPPPGLDLFDLDEEFAPERVRLSQLTNKCKADDVEYYILQAAEVMGVTKKLRSPRNRDPRALLDYVFRQVVEYKKVNSGPVAPQEARHGDAASRVAAADNAAAAAAAENMMRVIRVSNDGTGDATPFDENPLWNLYLEADFAKGTIEGNLQLLQDSSRFGAQEARIEGDIKPPGEREYPMEWGVVLDAADGEQIIYVFLGMIQGNQLRGVCEQGGGGNTRNFLYTLEEL